MLFHLWNPWLPSVLVPWTEFDGTLAEIFKVDDEEDAVQDENAYKDQDEDEKKKKDKHKNKNKEKNSIIITFHSSFFF